MSISTLVGNKSVSILVSAGLLGDTFNGFKKPYNFWVRGSLAKVREARISPLWNHQYMKGRLRKNIRKGKSIVILVHFFARNFRPQDLGKNIFGVVMYHV